MAFVGELYPFQKEGFDLMVERGKVLLAFHMGLGKTPTTIAVLEELYEQEKISSGLIIAPVGMKYQWAEQIEKFTDGASYVVVDGPPKVRERLYEEAQAGQYDYVILNYEQVVNDWLFVSMLPRDFVVADEVTAIKHFKAKRSKRLKQLQAPYLFGLTGQPIENRPEEAFSIMQWIDKHVFGRYDIFDRTFIVRNSWGSVKYYKNIRTFQRSMESAMCRKTKEEVKDQLPSVVEKNEYVQLDKRSADLYTEMAGDLLDEIDRAMELFGPGFDVAAHYGEGVSGQELAVRGDIMSKLMCIRMFCCHPDLVRISAKAYGAVTKGSTQQGSAYAHVLQQTGKLAPQYGATKFDHTLELVEEILSEDPVNKIVLFSFFKPMLRLLHEAIPQGSVQFTGDMNAKEKNAAKKRFQTDPNVRVFLSSDAGGYGLDLPEANYLINYDLPWSAGKLDQRNARIIRLSSEFESCTLINVLVHGSIEVRQHDMLKMKRKIASAFLDGRGVDKKGGLRFDLSTLRDFLEHSEV